MFEDEIYLSAKDKTKGVPWQRRRRGDEMRNVGGLYCFYGQASL